MDTTTHPYFVPNGDSRQETAILLVGTADEFGIDQRDIKSTREGFRITEALAKHLGFEEDEPEVPTHDEDGFPLNSEKPKPVDWNSFSDAEKRAYVYEETGEPDVSDVLTGQVPVPQPADEASTDEASTDEAPTKPARKRAASKN